jgi:hypothetical protein
MTTNTPLDEVLALALKLPPKERLQLIERVASSVEDEIAVAPAESEPPKEHWGKNLLRLLDEIGPIELDYPEIEDPVEWVKQIRRDQKRNLDWGDEA